MPLDVVATLCDLVKLPSVNPMGREVSGPEYFEYRMTEYLQSLFDRLGVPWERQTVAPLRDNIVARLDGDTRPEDGGPLVMIEAHQDTVPVEGMVIPPWDAQQRDGRVYGRGACDIKGGMASMLAAFSRLIDERPAGRPTVIMACSVNEEHGFSGATQITQWWAGGKSRLLPRAPDAIVVAEPTGLDVVVAHKGVVRWKCHTSGRAVHSSNPQRGENAIYRMAPVLAALEAYARDVVGTLGEHPLVGRPTLSVGTIAGGISVNTVPDRCIIEIDRRVLPGEDPLEAYRHVLDYVARSPGVGQHVHHSEPFITARGLSDANNGPLAARLLAAAQARGTSSQRIGVPYGTDGAAFTAAKVPTVVFGPGSIEQAHTKDEWIAVDQLKQAAEVLYEFIRQA